MRKVTINGKDFELKGNSMLDSLDSVFASEAVTYYDDKNYSTRYRLNDADLKTLSDIASESITGCFYGIHTIGKLMAYVNEEDISDDINSIGWLITGLSTIGSKVCDIAERMNHDLHLRQHIDKQSENKSQL